MSFHLNIKSPESNFPTAILERGINYLFQGRVDELSFDGDSTWIAAVKGSEPYTVRVQLLDDNVVKADCSCPYAVDAPCKHIAAVLMAIADEEGDQVKEQAAGEENVSGTKKDDFTALLESATKKELIGYIKKAAQFNSNIVDQITTMVKTGSGGLGKPGYRKIVKKALAPARRKGMMYGSEARRHLVPVYELLDQAEKMKASGSTRDLLDICQVVMEEMVPALQFIDDSSADVGDSLRWATGLLLEMADRPLKENRAPFFKWCLKSLRDKRYKGWDFEDDFLAMAVSLAQTDKQIEKIGSFMDEKIHAMEKSPDDWSSRYRLEQTLLQKERLLRKTGDDAGADALLEKYQFLTGVYKRLIETAWKREEYGRVKELAEAAIEKFEKKAPGLRKDWNEWLMKVAEKQSSPGEVLDRTLGLLGEDPSMERYVKIKGLIPVEEWHSYLKEKVLPALRLGFMGRRLLPEIFAMEEMWEELLSELKKISNLEALKQYQHHFSERGELPAVDEIFDIYEEIIWEALARRADRKNYRNVCRMLNRANAFGPAGHTKRLVRDIRETYSNRPSLLEELGNYGF